MKRILCCLMALLPLTGCQTVPFARELESTMLVQVLGIDWGETVTLTAASAPGEEGSDPVLTGEGADLAEAQKALEGSWEKYISLTHVAQLVVGADTDFATVLDAALQEPALGQNATVWIAVGMRAETLLKGAGGGAKRLSSIEFNADTVPLTVIQALMRLEEQGQVTVPALALQGEKLEPAGNVTIRRENHDQ